MSYLKKKIIIKLISSAVVLYFAIALGFYFFQDRILFQSKALNKEYIFQFSQNFHEYFIPTPDGETLNALLFKANEPAKGLIIYFHGNADNLQRWGQYAVDYTQLGYDILMMDYRGYGKSSGTPHEKILYEDAATIWEWARTNLPHPRIIIYGRSLGSPIASNLAITTHPDLLILETPFKDVRSVISPVLIPWAYLFPLRHHFSNYDFLSKVRCRKVIIHGTQDWVVPLSSPLQLKPLLAKTDTFALIEGGGHKNLRDFPEFHKILKRVLN